MPHGVNNTPLVGWHPSAGLVAWLNAEVERRGGGRGVRSAILEEALASYKRAREEEASCGTLPVTEARTVQQQP